VSAPTGDWFDLFVDGVMRVESRNFDGQQVVRGLNPGQHHVRVMDFVGTSIWSQAPMAFGCGDVVVAEITERGGLQVISSWSTVVSRPAERPRPVSYRPSGYRTPQGRRGHPGSRRPGAHRPQPASYRAPRQYTCEPGALAVVPFNNAWFDLYVDGQKRVESRNDRGRQWVIEGLAPGRHHVRVRSFTGQNWSSATIEVGCNQQVAGEVVDRQGLRFF
jgi:hypothetical protein